MIRLQALYLSAILLLIIVGCMPPTQEIISEVDIDLSSSDFQQLYQYIDERNVDSILPYTSHYDPAYRYMTAIGLASIQEEVAIDSLTALLEDPVIKVRAAAAYALGQLGSQGVVTALMESFRRKDTIDVDNIFNSAILEAIGKSGDPGLLTALATVSTYRKTDTLLLLGQARALYRFGIRGEYTQEATEHMAELVIDPTYPLAVRQLGSEYLERFYSSLDMSAYQQRLIKAYTAAEDIHLRSNLASVVTRIADKGQLQALLDNAADAELDYRERIAIIKHLGGYPYIQVVDAIIKLLSDDNLHVAHAAGDYLIENGNSSDAAVYHSFITEDMRFSVKAKIYEAVLQNIPLYYTNTKAKYKKEIQEAIDATKLMQEKIAYITALSKDPYAYEQLISIGLGASNASLRSATAQALSDLLLSDNYQKAYRASQRYHTRQILGGLHSLMRTGDVGVVAVVGEMVGSGKMDLTPYLQDSLSIYRSARSSLSLPGHIESYNAMSKAISKITGEKYVAKTPTHNQPISWSKIAALGDTITAVIKTSKGNIKLHLDPVHAPGTVSNFVSLALDDYYDEKIVHRVVPDFVIQGGCSRGDGYGGLNYTIRSELGPKYYDGAGYIGMASAGRDTEGTQWFITHSATPHLDGRYTIFGRVIEGMDVVHKIMPGDITYDVIVGSL